MNRIRKEKEKERNGDKLSNSLTHSLTHSLTLTQLIDQFFYDEKVCRAEADRVLILQALERIEKTFEVPPGSSSEQMHNQHRCATPLDDCRMALKRLFVMKMLG